MTGLNWASIRPEGAFITKPEHDYYLIENTYVARYDPMSGKGEQLMPDGTWVPSIRTHEILNGRPLHDEKDALDTAAFLNARDREREARKHHGS